MRSTLDTSLAAVNGSTSARAFKLPPSLPGQGRHHRLQNQNESAIANQRVKFAHNSTKIMKYTKGGLHAPGQVATDGTMKSKPDKSPGPITASAPARRLKYAFFL